MVPWRLAEEMAGTRFTCWAVAAVTFFARPHPHRRPRSLVATTVGQSLQADALRRNGRGPRLARGVRSLPTTAAVLGNPVMRYAGDISYGVFLYHLVVLDAVMSLLDNQLWSGKVIQVLPLTLAGAVLLATLSFRFLERPVTRRAHRTPAPAPRVVSHREDVDVPVATG